MQPAFFPTESGRTLAYEQLPASGDSGPGVVFLGGFRSDMTGTKAEALADWARARGRAYLRFDYSGHGQSSGDFLDGAIGDWFDDARAIITALTQGPQILVGSSMGGWIALLCARAMPERLAGLVTIAAAPDFTEDLMWAQFTPAERQALETTGQIAQPSDYSDAPYIITRRLIEDGRNHLVLRSPLNLPFPVRFLQGSADVDVPPRVALALFDHARGADIRLSLVKGADHRFSSPACLAQITAALDAMTGAA